MSQNLTKAKWQKVVKITYIGQIAPVVYFDQGMSFQPYNIVYHHEKTKIAKRQKEGKIQPNIKMCLPAYIFVYIQAVLQELLLQHFIGSSDMI